MLAETSVTQRSTSNSAVSDFSLFLVTGTAYFNGLNFLPDCLAAFNFNNTRPNLQLSFGEFAQLGAISTWGPVLY